MKRKIFIPIESIMALFVDYTKGTNDVPDDAKPLSLMINRNERGMFAIMADSPQWTDDTPIRINFDIKRVFSV